MLQEVKIGGKNSAPPPPDYSQLAATSEASAKLQFQLGQDQLAWAKKQYASDREVLDKIVSASMERQKLNDGFALKDRERYEKIYQPLENELAQEAQDYNSEGRQQYEMGRAAASVGQQFDSAREAALSNLESYGIDPSSTRYAALDLGTRIEQAAAQAGAANTARGRVEDVGRALRSEAINVGRGYPGQIAGTYGTAQQAGNSSANTQLAGTASGASTMGTGAQWTQGGVNALNTWGNTLNMGYDNQLAAYTANQNSSSGLGGLLGAGAALAGNAGFAFAEGGAVPEALPGVTHPGNVPHAMSPSGGRAIDDVPARLTAGEFVLPRDVVSWKGEEFFQKLIDGSRKSKPQAAAQPTPMRLQAPARATAQAPAQVPAINGKRVTQQLATHMGVIPPQRVQQAAAPRAAVSPVQALQAQMMKIPINRNMPARARPAMALPVG